MSGVYMHILQLKFIWSYVKSEKGPSTKHLYMSVYHYTISRAEIEPFQ